jgi:hypothetical protein
MPWDDLFDRGRARCVGGLLLLDILVLATTVILEFFLLEARLGDGKEEGAVKGVLLAVLTQRRLLLGLGNGNG